MQCLLEINSAGACPNLQRVRMLIFFRIVLASCLGLYTMQVSVKCEVQGQLSPTQKLGNLSLVWPCASNTLIRFVMYKASKAFCTMINLCNYNLSYGSFLCNFLDILV